jgi:tetratricopeptide (TPR) repeat protein
VTTEIEKLERRWQENPLGLTFAPLAEAYRKSGALARALELLDTGLAQHPGYVPAHIVRGRCHLDSGERALAELDFLCVAELDPENVIALKALADLAEDEGRTSDAIRRLESVLEIDRNNEEAEVQLVRLRTDLASENGSGELIVPRDDASTLTPSNERLEGIEILAVEANLPSASAGSPVFQEEVLLPEAKPATEPPGLADLPEELTAWLEEPIPPIEPPAEPLAPVAADVPEPGVNESLVAEDPAPEADLAVAPVPESDVPAPAAESPAGVASEEALQDPGEPDLMVTETMAEIFLRQGHRELALAVYTQLLQREPDNERVKTAAADLAASLAPAVPESQPEAPPEPVRRYDAASTGGRPVQEALASLLSAGRPRPAQPVHPPAFDRESAAPPEPSPEPSFDEFFASPEPPAPASSAVAPAPAPEGTGEPARAADPEELEQFHAWLRGLKT